MLVAQVLNPELLRHSLKHNAERFLMDTVSIDAKTSEVVSCWFQSVTTNDNVGLLQLHL